MALRSNGIHLLGVRGNLSPRACATDPLLTLVPCTGPKTCSAVRASVNYYPPSCPHYGDPGLYSQLLIPSWFALRPQPASAADSSAPMILCAAAHLFDTNLGLHAARLSKRQADALVQWENTCYNTSGGHPTLFDRLRQDSQELESGDAVRNHSYGRALLPIRAASQGVTATAACTAPFGRPPPQIQLVSMRQRVPLVAAKRMLACDLVVSSALHGIVVADALRIPSLWLSSTAAAPSRPTNDRTSMSYADGADNRRLRHEVDTIDQPATHAQPFKVHNHLCQI